MLPVVAVEIPLLERRGSMEIPTDIVLTPAASAWPQREVIVILSGPCEIAPSELRSNHDENYSHLTHSDGSCGLVVVLVPRNIFQSSDDLEEACPIQDDPEKDPEAEAAERPLLHAYSSGIVFRIILRWNPQGREADLVRSPRNRSESLQTRPHQPGGPSVHSEHGTPTRLRRF